MAANQAADLTNISPPSAHRLPTVSASQALLRETHSANIPRQLCTGLRQLDHLPCPCRRRHRDGTDGAGSSTLNERDAPRGVLSRGQITELYGPPGVGKTAFGLQVAAHALHAGDHVVWVDCGIPLVGARLQEILSGVISQKHENHPSASETRVAADDVIDHLEHFTAPTLPHLLALLFNPPVDFPPTGTSLIVIDSISALFGLAFPRLIQEPIKQPQQYGSKRSTAHNKNDALQWASTRRWAIMTELVAKLNKLAAIKDVAIVLINQTVTRIRPGAGAMLVPGISSFAWDSGISNRILLYRDWLAASPSGDPDLERNPSTKGTRHVRFAAVLKSSWSLPRGGEPLPKAVAFVIGSGLWEVDNVTARSIRPKGGTGTAATRTAATGTGMKEAIAMVPDEAASQVPVKPEARGAKRKRIEVADSESDMDADEADDDVKHALDADVPVDADERDSYGWADADDLSLAAVVQDMIDGAADIDPF